MRELLTETAKPWKNPATTLDAPTPIISALASTSSPRRAAKLDAVAMVSVSDTIVMPTAPTMRATASDALVHGRDGVGKPWGNVPTVFTPSSARPSRADTTVTPTMATSTAGIRVVIRGSTSRTSSTASPVISVVRLVWSSPFQNAFSSSTNPSASVENPNSLGSWPTIIVTARPFM